MKVLIVGRGIEGCGVTKFTEEFRKFLISKKVEHAVFACNDKTWTRKKSFDTKDWLKVHLEKDEQYNKFIDFLKNKASQIIIMSLPSLSHSDVFQKRFKEILALGIDTVLFQHDHARNSIQRNACLDDAIGASSICFTHSTNNYFAQYVDSNFNSTLDRFFNPDATQKKVIAFQPAFDFDECRKKYWKDIDEQDAKHHKWIGRCTFWKGFQLMFDWCNTSLQVNNNLTTFEGIEAGIVYPEFIKYSPHNNYCRTFTDATQKIFDDASLDEKYIAKYNFYGTSNIEEVDLSQKYGKGACVFGIYKNNEMLDRLSRCGFGYQLTLLKKENIERSIEYTHCEVVACGAIPVFHRKFGQYVKHRKYGKPLIECKDNGTIWLDESSFEESINTIKKLEKDKVLRNEWREMAFDFYKNHQHSDYVFSDILEEIK